MARRTGESTIPAQIVKEADGFTAQDAQNFDVESNIKDEKGTTKDYVRYFERRPELSEEAARNGGLLARKGINAWKIARIGSDDVRSQFLSGKISERKAVAISEGAPRSDAAQAAGLSRAGKLSAEELKAFVSIINQAVPENANKAEQGDLFGFDDSYLKEQEKIASMVAKDKAFIGEKIRAVKGALRNPQAAEEMGLKFEATPENIAAEVEKLNMQSAALDRFYLNSDLMRYYRNKINGKDAGSLDDILNLSVVSESAVEPDPNQGTLFQKGVGGLSALFTDETARSAYISETAAMFADQVLAEANFRKTSIDSVLKASDIVFEDGGIKFKIGERIFDADGNVLEQAMYPSNKPDFSAFYDYAQTKPEKKSYYNLSLDDLLLRIPQDVTIHDKNDHSLTEQEWKGVFEGIKNPIDARVSLKPNSYGKISALLKINANGRLYGVSVTLSGQNNYISTAFKTTDAGYVDWVNKKNKWTSDMPAPKNPARPSPVKHGDVIIGKSLNEIISNLRSEINIEYNQSAFAGSRVDYDKPSLEAIGSGEGQQVHGWGLYYALDKDVAEGYRETFINENSTIEYKDKKYSKEENENEFFALQTLRDSETKEEALEYLEDSANKLNKRILEVKDESTKERLRKMLYNVQEQIELVKNIDFDDVARGQVHEVDIPENPYLLDEQKPFSEQSDFVKEKLNELFDNIEIPAKALVNFTGSASNPYKNVAKHKTGREIYEDLARILHSDKAASELLLKYGIKGITNGRTAGFRRQNLDARFRYAWYRGVLKNGRK